MRRALYHVLDKLTSPKLPMIAQDSADTAAHPCFPHLGKIIIFRPQLTINYFHRLTPYMYR